MGLAGVLISPGEHAPFFAALQRGAVQPSALGRNTFDVREKAIVVKHHHTVPDEFRKCSVHSFPLTKLTTVLAHITNN